MLSTFSGTDHFFVMYKIPYTSIAMGLLLRDTTAESHSDVSHLLNSHHVNGCPFFFFRLWSRCSIHRVTYCLRIYHQDTINALHRLIDITKIHKKSQKLCHLKSREVLLLFSVSHCLAPRSDFISSSIRLGFINVPTVAAASEECNIDTTHALFASVCMHRHCIAPQRPRNMDFSRSVTDASGVFRRSGLLSAGWMLST